MQFEQHFAENEEGKIGSIIIFFLHIFVLPVNRRSFSHMLGNDCKLYVIQRINCINHNTAEWEQFTPFLLHFSSANCSLWLQKTNKFHLKNPHFLQHRTARYEKPASAREVITVKLVQTLIQVSRIYNYEKGLTYYRWIMIQMGKEAEKVWVSIRETYVCTIPCTHADGGGACVHWEDPHWDIPSWWSCKGRRDIVQCIR